MCTSAGSSIAGSAVRQRGEGGDAAGGRGGGGRGDGLAVFVARLAERGAHVHQAGAEHGAVFLDDDRTVRTAEAGAEIRDHAVAHQQVALRVHAGGRVEQADAEEERVGGHAARLGAHPPPLEEGVGGRGAMPAADPSPQPPPSRGGGVFFPPSRCCRSVIAAVPPRQRVQHRHAHRDPHLHLLA